MPTLTLQPELAAQLESVAIERSVMPDGLLATAVRAYLRQVEREKSRRKPAHFAHCTQNWSSSTWGNTLPSTKAR